MAVTESELFRDYEHDFERLRQDIDERLECASGTKAADGDVRQWLNEADRLVGDAGNALRQMEMEAKTMPPEQRKDKEPRLRMFREELAERRKALSAAKSSANRQSLLGEGEDLGPKSRRDRERLLDVDDSLRRSSSKLDEAHRQALETEQIGVDVMSDLRSQRDVIRHTQQSVSEIGDHVARAKHTLGVMGRRAMANRVLMYVAVGSLALMVILAIYFGTAAEEEKQEEATRPGFFRATGQVCTGASYTNNMGVGCNGWSGITEAECQRLCDISAQAENCPVLPCAAAAFYTADPWCHLYTGPECATQTSEEGVNTFKKVETPPDSGQAGITAAPSIAATPATLPTLAQAPPFSPSGGGRLLQDPAAFMSS